MTKTVACFSLRALAAQFLFFIFFASIVVADLTITTTTLTSTTTVLTSTITVTTNGGTHETLTTATSTKKIKSKGIDEPSATMTWGRGHGDFSTSQLKSQVLNSTNYFRSQHEARALSWDPSLAQYAQRYVDRCVWEHSVILLVSCTSS